MARKHTFQKGLQEVALTNGRKKRPLLDAFLLPHWAVHRHVQYPALKSWCVTDRRSGLRAGPPLSSQYQARELAQRLQAVTDELGVMPTDDKGKPIPGTPVALAHGKAVTEYLRERSLIPG